MMEQPHRFQREDDALDDLMSVKGIGEQIARVMVRKGVMSRDDLRRIDDAVLLQVPGIGPVTLRRIREQIQE